MVNEHSTISNIQQYIESSDLFTTVKSHHNKRKGKVFFEASSNQSLTEEAIRNADDLEMVFDTYGMDLTIREDSKGIQYYRFSCNDDYFFGL